MKYVTKIVGFSWPCRTIIRTCDHSRNC